MLMETGSLTTVRDIIKAASRVSGVPIKDITGMSRKRVHVHLRAAIVHIACKLRKESNRFRWSYPLIGAALGRDHTTVIYIRDNWQRFCASDADLPVLVEKIEAELSQPGQAPMEWGAAIKHHAATLLEKRKLHRQRRRRKATKLKNRIRPKDVRLHHVRMKKGSDKLRDAILASRG